MDNTRRPANLKPGVYRFDEFFYERIYGKDGYHKNGNGVGVDYDTHVSADPLFSLRVAQWIDEKWRLLGEPEELFVYELGSGDGTLCKQILSSGTKCAKSIRYVAIETNELLHSCYPQNVEVVSRMPSTPTSGVLIGCSVLNAQPPRFISYRDDAWQELSIEIDESVSCVWHQISEPLPNSILACEGLIGSVPWVQNAISLLTDTLRYFTGHVVLVDSFCLKTTDLPGTNWVMSMRNRKPVPSLDLSIEASMATIVPVDQLEEALGSIGTMPLNDWFVGQTQIYDGFCVMEFEVTDGCVSNSA